MLHYESLLTTPGSRSKERVPLALPSSLLVEAARDMEPRTNLTAARHYIQNLMAAFANFVTTRDVPAMSRLLGLCRVTHHPLKGGANLLNTRLPGGLLSWCNGSAMLTTTDLSVWNEDRDVVYHCTYQIWQPGKIAPLTAMGTFAGRLESGPQAWRWLEHHIHEH